MRYLSALAAFWLIGCASSLTRSNALTAREVSEGCTIRNDEFAKYSGLSGPPYWIGEDCSVNLIKVLKKPGNIRLHVSAFPREWAFYDEARDRDGKVYKLQNIDRKAEARYVCESFGIDFPYDQLSAATGEGLTLRLYGKRGQYTFTVPGFYIRGYLDRLDELEPRQPAASKGR